MGREATLKTQGGKRRKCEKRREAEGCRKTSRSTHTHTCTHTHMHTHSHTILSARFADTQRNLAVCTFTCLWLKGHIDWRATFVVEALLLR